MGIKEAFFKRNTIIVFMQLLVLCSIWMIVNICLAWIDTYVQTEILWLRKAMCAGVQYAVAYAAVKRMMNLSFPKRKIDKELYGIGIIFSVGFLAIAIYRTSQEMPLYVDEVFGYILEEFLLIALLEELIFRGLVSEILGKMKTLEKVVCSALIFTFMHYISWVPDVFDFELYEVGILLFSPCILGLLLAWLFEIRKDVGLTVIVHGTYNVLTLISYGNIRIMMCISYIFFAITYCIYCTKKGRKNEKIMIYTMVLALILSSMSGIFAEEVPAVETGETPLEVTLENLENEDEEVTELSDELLKGEAEPGADYQIDSEEALQDELEMLDANSETYQEDLQEIMENANPEAYAALVEAQANDIVESLDELDEMEPDESLRVKEKNGDTTTLDTYKLDSGAEIVVGGIDESMDDDAYINDNLFSPGVIAKATWVTNKNIWKEQGKRRYTAIYYLKVGKVKKGKITVTNHYTVNKSSITMRSPAIWEYDCETPLEITIKKGAYKSSRAKLTKAGQQFYAGAQYYVTSMKKSNTTVETSVGAEAGVTVSAATASTVEWSENETKLHRIFAVVKLNKFTKNGAYLKQSGEVQFAE